jgi:hypothetical protein
MKSEQFEIRTLDENATREKEAEVTDLLASSQRDIDEYIKMMTNLRCGNRPILCW